MLYEATRLKTRDPGNLGLAGTRQPQPFQRILPDDPFGQMAGPTANALLDAATSVPSWPTMRPISHNDLQPVPAQIRAAMARMGIDVTAPAMDELYGQAAQAALLPASRLRLPLLTPASADDFHDQFD